MKIGVEASAVFRTNKTGVGWYSHELVKALVRVMPDDEFDLGYISFFTKQPEKLKPSPPNVRYRRISLLPGKIYNFMDHYLVALPFDVLARTRADVFFFPNYFRLPLWLTHKSVVAIHDLAFLETPEYIVPHHREYMSRRVPQSVQKATHVIAVSEHTKRTLVSEYKVDPSKVTVVVPAIDHAKFQPATKSNIDSAKKKYGIAGEYLLFLGTTDPRKNITGIVKAYQLLPEEMRKQYKLVLAGAPGKAWGWGWYDTEIDAIIAELPQGSVIRTGYVSAEDRPVLFSGAALFLWPSHYEGWGMPIVEALACGTPVVTARNSSLPEAGGDAAAYVENNQPSSISQTIVELLNDPEKLAHMRSAGLEHVKQFTWDASASRLAGVLRELVKP
jgi:glycosyltransferase involved in cell wall biosynthesis